jgi:hypothetical protein
MESSAWAIGFSDVLADLARTPPRVALLTSRKPHSVTTGSVAEIEHTARCGN